MLQCECNDIGYRNLAARLGKMRAIWVICTKMGKGALELGGKFQSLNTVPECLAGRGPGSAG